MIKKIVQLSDIQVEVRKYNRIDEYLTVFNNTYNKIKELSPDRIVITGDIFENWDANDEEENLIVNLFKNLLSLAPKVIIIGGNHDYKQKENFIIDKGIKTPLTSRLEVVIKAIDNKNLCYYEQTGFYEDENIVWCVWGHKQKFHPYLRQKYNPFDIEHPLNFIKTGKEKQHTYIELYHDPVNESVDFLDREVRSTQGISIHNFESDIILAGDIHKPMIVKNKKGNIFTYSSSLIIRNFKEGDYYINNKIIQDGNEYHGLNFIDVEHKLVNFIKIENSYSFHTFILDEDFDYNNISLRLRKTEHNRVKVRPKHLLSKFEPSKIEQYFYNNYGINVIITRDELSIDDSTVVAAASSQNFITAIKDKKVQREILMKYYKDNAYSEDDIKILNEYDDKVESYMGEDDTVFQDVTIKKITVNNFRTFGDNVRLNFDSKGIYKITANNEVGKTTLLEALKLIFTGATSKTANIDSHTKTSKLALNTYLNDTREKDTCSVTLYLSVNHIDYEITYLVERDWKKDKPKYFIDKTEQVKEHIRNISKTVTVKEKRNGKWQQVVDGISFITSIIKDYADYINIVETNADNLNNIINLKDEELVEYLLKNLGIGFAEKKKEIFNEKVKPEFIIKTDLKKGDDVKLQNEIKSNDEKIKYNQQSIYDIEHQISTINETVKKLTEELNFNLKQINPIKEDLLNQEQMINDKINQLILLKNKLNEEYNEKNTFLLNNNIEFNEDKYEDLKQIKSNYNQWLQSKNNEIALLQNKIESLKTNIEKYNQEFSKVIDLEVSLIDESISEIDLTVKETTMNIQTENHYINSIKNDFQNTQKTNITLMSNLQINLNRIKNEGIEIKKNIEELDSDYNIEYNNLLNSKTCLHCGREYDQTHRGHVETKIEELTLKYNKKREELLKKREEKGIEYKSVNSEIEKLKTANEDIDNILLGKKEDESIKKRQDNINNFKNDIVENEKKREQLSLIKKDYYNSQYHNNHRILDSLNEFNVNVTRANEKINEYLKLILDIQEEIVTEKGKFDDALVELENFEKVKLKLKELELVKKDLVELPYRINQLNQEHQYLENDLREISYQKLLFEKNKQLEIKNNEIEGLIKSHNKNMENWLNKKTEFIKLNTELETINKTYRDRLNLYASHLRQRDLFDIYSRVMDKKGLPQLIFNKIRNSINKELSDLLKDLTFKIYFDENNILKMIDLSNNQKTERETSEGSGMQRTFAILAIKNILRKYNNRFKLNYIVIDEITGKLDDINKDRMVKVLRKLCENVDILFLIDQNILNGDKLDSDLQIVLEKTSEGTIIREVIEKSC